jgi:hypothetical protein
MSGAGKGGSPRRPAIRLAAALAFLVALVPLGAAAPRALPLTPCTLTGGIAARCGSFAVPENRAQPEGRTISLRVAVLPARDSDRAPDPIVVLAGGPGGSAIAEARGMLSVFSATNATRDIVLVDQRGTGGSNRLECPQPGRPFKPTAAAVRAQDPLASVRDAIRELPSSRTVVVPAAGHGSVQLGCLPRLARQFIEEASAASLDARCAARYKPPPFAVP